MLVQGNNGHGKSNLLEALYLLVIGKSQRASTERELVRRDSVGVEFFSQVAAVVQREDGPIRAQIDFKNTVAESSGADAQERLSVQKSVRVNGIPRRASELVGEINAVMFSAQDLDMVYGAPGLRRRYMDILISQVDREYLRAVRRYQRVVVQRNHLLKGIKARRARASDLEFWDGELVKSGGIVAARRQEALRALSAGADAMHASLTSDGDTLRLAYRPSFRIDGRRTPEDVGEALREAVMEVRSREIAQGFSLRGPHRDDFQLLLEDVDVGLFSSRGQARTAMLALKLAEAEYLKNARGQQPILLLDDVLSELDSPRRRLVLRRVADYGQVFITTADVDIIEPEYLNRMARFAVCRGQLERVHE